MKLQCKRECNEIETDKFCTTAWFWHFEIGFPKVQEYEVFSKVILLVEETFSTKRLEIQFVLSNHKGKFDLYSKLKIQFFEKSCVDLTVVHKLLKIMLKVNATFVVELRFRDINVV